jgi:hypothetical protein
MADVKIKDKFNRATRELVVDTEEVFAGILEDTPETAQIATVTLTAAQVKTLFASPVTLVPAQGAGKTIVVDHIFGKSVGDTAAFDAATSTLQFRYTGASGALATADLPNTFIEAADGATVLGSVSSVATAVLPVANAPIVAFITAANPAANTAAGTITLTVVYRVFS